MARFGVQGRLKPLFTAEGVSFGLEPRDLSQYRIGVGLRLPEGQSIPFLKPRLVFIPSVILYSFSSSSLKRSTRFIAEVRLTVGEDCVFDDYDGAEFERDELSCFRGLVLDISYRPVNVVCWRRAICLEFMEKADVLEYYDQTVNSASGSFNIPAVLQNSSSSSDMYLTSLRVPECEVPHLLQVVKRRRIKTTLNRKNIFFRDNYMCQYCSSKQNLTIDHVLPIARGGRRTWENLHITPPGFQFTRIAKSDFWGSLFPRLVDMFELHVTACAKCNSRKGHKTIEEAAMKLIKIPKIPKDYDVLTVPLTNTAIKMLSVRKGTPREWHQYL